MTFHYIEVETYCHATEDPVRVREALGNLLGEDTEIEEVNTRGYYGNTITVMRRKISGKREIREFFERLPQEIKTSLRDSLGSRTDDDCNLYFRIDKGSAYLEEPELSDGGYVIKFRGKVEVYPAKREKALAVLEEFFSH